MSNTDLPRSNPVKVEPSVINKTKKNGSHNPRHSVHVKSLFHVPIVGKLHNKTFLIHLAWYGYKHWYRPAPVKWEVATPLRVLIA